MSFRLNLTTRRYPLTEQIHFHQRLLDKLRSLPGVQAAGVASQIPLDPYSWGTDFEIEGRPAAVPGEVLNMEAHLVSPDYFRAMGIPLLPHLSNAAVWHHLRGEDDDRAAIPDDGRA